MALNNLLFNINDYDEILALASKGDRYGVDLKVRDIYDSNDDKFGSCAKIFSSGNEDLESRELVLEVGDGHGVFYKPLDVWVQPAINWSRP